MSNPFLLQSAYRHVSTLLSGLSKALHFHNRHHTEDVFLLANNMALLSNLPLQDILILQLAALFHDTGYLYTYKGHENVSKQLALDFLTGESCSEELIEGVLKAIDATKIPQQPQNEVQNILCDADLAHLAHLAYPEYSRLLRKEWSVNKIEKYTTLDWLENNLNFMRSHQFFSKIGKELLQAGKQRNIDFLTVQLSRD